MKKKAFIITLFAVAIQLGETEYSFASTSPSNVAPKSIEFQQVKPVADTLFNKYYDATGGRALWSSIKGYSATQKYTSSVNYDVVLSADLIEKSLHKSRIAMKREFIYVTKPTDGWLKIPIGGTDKATKYQTNALNATEKTGLVSEMYNTLVPFYDYKNRGLIATYVGSETVGGKKVEQVELQDKGSVYNLYFDAQTNLLTQAKVKSGGVEVMRTYSDYVKSKTGILYPSKVIETNLKDKKVTTITTSDLVINPVLNKAMFQK